MSIDDDKVSKQISYLLRHKRRYTDDRGFVSVEKVLFDTGITFEDLVRIVNEDKKQRYSFNEDFSEVRANQGHSTGIKIELECKTPPDILYHGTATRFLNSIKGGGILKMSRDYVHLSSNLETAIQVEKRHGDPVVLEVDAKHMHEDGIPFYLSQNGVWLVDKVDREYFKVRYV